MNTERLAATRVSKRVWEALEVAKDISDSGESGFVLVAGRGRIGKSFTSQVWVEDHPDRAKYYLFPGTGGQKLILEDLAVMEKVDPNLNYNRLNRKLRAAYTPPKGAPSRILVVDQAHNLLVPPTAAMPKLDMFIGLHDWCRLVVVFLFTLKKFSQMMGASEYASEQFFGRCRYQVIIRSVPLKRISDGNGEMKLEKVSDVMPEEIRKLVAFYEPKLVLDDDVLTLLSRVAGDEKMGFTKVVEIVKDARRYAKKKGVDLTTGMLKNIAVSQEEDIAELTECISEGSRGWRARR